MTDYRNVDEEDSFIEIPEKKDKFSKKLKEKHPRSNNHYRYVSAQNELKKEFAKIYNEKCGYCGTDYNVIPFNNFEVDHFICKSSEEDNVNLLPNLVYSCHYCNRKKDDLYIKEENRRTLNPDYNLGKTLIRDKMMYINIKNELKTCEEVKIFYDTLHFSDERRRIEFLLRSLISYKNQIDNNYVKEQLLEIIEKLRRSYNRNF